MSGRRRKAHTDHTTPSSSGARREPVAPLAPQALSGAQNFHRPGSWPLPCARCIVTGHGTTKDALAHHSIAVFITTFCTNFGELRRIPQPVEKLLRALFCPRFRR